MLEVFEIATSGITLIPTIMLGLTLVYWVLVILGALDIDFFDVDVEVEAESGIDLEMESGIDGGGDAEVEVETNLDSSTEAGGISGALKSILIFFNADYIPIMIIFSFTILGWWLIAVSIDKLFGFGNSLIGVALVPLEIIAALLLSKLISQPFRKFFKESKVASTQTVGSIGTLLSDLTCGRIGQVEIKTSGAPITANAMCRLDTPLKKGTTVIIYDKDKTKNIYIVEPFTDWKE